MKKEKANENETFLTVKEICSLTNLNSSTLYTILHYDKLEHETIGGRIVIREKTFDDWLKRNSIPQKNDETKTKEKVQRKKKEVKQ